MKIESMTLEFRFDSLLGYLLIQADGSAQVRTLLSEASDEEIERFKEALRSALDQNMYRDTSASNAKPYAL